MRRVLAHRTLVWLGLVSYGIYLWQEPAINRIGAWTGIGPGNFLDPNALWLVVGPPFVIAVAAISYYLLERPALSLKRLVSPRAVAPDEPGAVSTPVLPGPR